MPAGRHGHKIRKLKRHMEAVLEEGREREKPPPPPISEEHATLRERIIEEWKAIEYEDSSPPGWGGPEPPVKLESLDHVYKAMDLMDEEKKLLAEHGVDYRPYETYDLS